MEKFQLIKDVDISSIDSMIYFGSATELAYIASKILRTSISDPKKFLEACYAARKNAAQLPLGKGFSTNWSESTWFAWLKNRLHEVEYPRLGFNIPREILCGTFNVGFVSIEETAIHLFRLRKDSGIEKTRPKIARSKIVKTNQIISPINIVAARVFRWKRKHETSNV